MSTFTCGSAGQLSNIDQCTGVYSQSMEKSQPEKPPRQKNIEKYSSNHSSSSSYVSSESSKLRGHDVSIYPSKSTKNPSRDGSRDEYDHDHHTFATATTASATISFSNSEANSVASEAGMEVVMSPNDSEMEATSNVEEYKTHSFPAGKHTFTVDTRYSMIRVVGSGAYGVVVSSKDSKNSECKNVAIKMVPKAFNDEIDAKRILREIKLLSHFQHENIISIVDMMPPTARYLEDFHDVYMVTDLMETDLHRIIYSKQKLSIDHAQYFLYQVLRGLKYIHSADVIHRDLKPSNLLVNSNCDLKICDFGLARGINQKESEGQEGTMLLTEYVVTRWYRAPEIMLACHEYSKAIDLWSVGCIFAELIQRKPYFPGEDYIDQLTIICEKLGKLPDQDLDFVTSEKAKRFMRKLPCKSPSPLRVQFPNAPADGLDLLRNMLQIHPRCRINVEDALSHKFLSQLHNEEDEPIAKESFDYSFEHEKLYRLRLQELIWREAARFRPSCLPVAPCRGGESTRSSQRRDP
mmetsp:Transcript_2793/g.5994  ORF Transcript_2793/g.5994 Transcript_2793/m.5994 type:complete len:521 (-) Transcript_2793:2394-3956(-)